MNEAFVAGVLGSLAAGSATGLGALPLLLWRKPTVHGQAALLGFAAGVMLAASFFSLIIPAVDVLTEGGVGKAAAAAIVAASVLAGGAAIGLLSRHVRTDIPSVGEAHGPTPMAQRLWLFLVAITLHNFPEGMAVGVSFGGGDFGNGFATALGIGVQNVPEGLAVGVALLALGYSRGISFAGALASGLVEPVGGALGAAVTVAFPALLPLGLGLAAGAMIYVVTAEIIPTMREEEHNDRPMIGLMVGLVGMMFLDIALG